MKIGGLFEDEGENMRSEGLEIFDQFPLLLIAQLTGSVIMTPVTIAVKACIKLVTSLRLLGFKSHIFWVELAAADIEGRSPVFRLLEQFPKVGHGSVMQVRRGGPNAVEGTAFVGDSVKGLGFSDFQVIGNQ